MENASKYICVNGDLMDLSIPKVMGILNITSDSFYSSCRNGDEKAVICRVNQIVSEGADIIDIGACSTRPGATLVSEEEELNRLRFALKVVRKEQPNAVVSIDTFRSRVAALCVEEYGAAIINDISGGEMDPNMFEIIAKLQVPYVLMHMQGTPQTMQQNPIYENVRKEVLLYFSKKVVQLQDLGLNDIILDPGFGFGKTLEHNYELMAHLQDFSTLNLPLLVGVSRKSMISSLLNKTPEGSLNGTTALNMYALMNGAHILRVHDVREALEVIRIATELKKKF